MVTFVFHVALFSVCFIIFTLWYMHFACLSVSLTHIYSILCLWLVVAVTMASKQAVGEFTCLCCCRPFGRRGNLIRHLQGARLWNEHLSFFADHANADRLLMSTGVDWAMVCDMRPEVANVGSARVDDGHPARAFHGAAGRDRLSGAVANALVCSTTLNAAIENLRGAGLGLTEDELELVALSAASAAQLTAAVAERLAGLTGRVGVDVQREQLELMLLKFGRPLPDITAGPWSDVEPSDSDDDSVQIVGISRRPRPSATVRSPQGSPEMILISDDECEPLQRCLTPLRCVYEDITPVSSPCHE